MPQSTSQSTSQSISTPDPLDPAADSSATGNIEKAAVASNSAPAPAAKSPAAGKAMAQLGTPLATPNQTGPYDTAKDLAIEARLLTPNDRDQVAQMTAQGSATEENADPMIAQAAADAKTNLKDTSKALETDRAYAKLRNDVQ